MGASLLLRLLSLDVALMIDFILVNLCKEQIASNKWCSVTTISIRSRRLPRKRLNLIFERNYPPSPPPPRTLEFNAKYT